jgi:hypothetical protein
VNFSPAFRWFIIVLIPLTLAWKLVEEDQTARDSKGNIIQFLSRHKLDVTERIVEGITIIEATSEECRLIVVEASPDGWMRDFVHHILGTTEHQFTVFRGSIYTEQPVWLTLTDHWWSKSLRKLGLARRDAPVITVSATESCDAEHLPWGELSSQDVRAPLLKTPDGGHVGESASLLRLHGGFNNGL